MAKPDVGFIDDGIKTAAVIKSFADLENAAWKDLVDRVKKFIAENEDATAKTPRSWKKDGWKELAKDFVENYGGESGQPGAGNEYFHKARDTDLTERLVWPDDQESIAYLAFSLIKFEAIKYHTAKRKAESEATGGSPGKKTKTTKKATKEADDGSPASEEAGEGGEGSKKEDDAESITVKPAKKPAARKATPAKEKPAKATPAKATPAKATSAKATPAKATKPTGFVNPMKKKAKNKEPTPPVEDEDSDEDDGSPAGGIVESIESDDIVEPKKPAEEKKHGDSIFNNGALPKEKSATPATLPKATAAKDPHLTFSVATETPKSGKSKRAASSEADESPLGRLPNKKAKVEVVVEVPADVEHSSPVVTGAKVEDDNDVEDADLLAMAVDEKQDEIAETSTSSVTTERIDTVAPLDTLIHQTTDRRDSPINGLEPAITIEHEPSKPVASLFGNSRVGSPHSEALSHIPNSLNAQMALFRSTPGQTPSVRSYHPTSQHSLSLSITLLSTPNNGITNAMSHLMVVPSSVTFAEVVGKYILQLPQGHADHQAMADAVSCTLKTASGKQQQFSIRDGAVERMWRAAVNIAARESRGLEEEQAIEVDIS